MREHVFTMLQRVRLIWHDTSPGAFKSSGFLILIIFQPPFRPQLHNFLLAISNSTRTSEHGAAPTGVAQGSPRNFHSTLLRLTGAACWPYISGQKKAGLNFLFIF